MSAIKFPSQNLALEDLQYFVRALRGMLLVPPEIDNWYILYIITELIRNQKGDT